MSQATVLHNIPSQPTPFIGREEEIADIGALLEDPNCRLLTLVGPGGIGKTRLAIESVNQLPQESFPNGIFFVPLAPLNNADDIILTLINVLGILIGDEGTPREELTKFLSQRHLLLITDNFEHMLDGVDLLTGILGTAPDVKILATSREALNLQMERLWHVKGMRFPQDDQLDDVTQYSALRLFTDRAMRVRHDFSVDNDLACMIGICQLVDGMPLALELAASWLKTLSCEDIIKHIQQGVDFLATRARDVPERHRSIRAVFDHSWQLLTEEEQTIFPCFAVFRGGFTLEAAETVAGGSLMTISGIVEKSMLRKLPPGRYDIHELLRQYAEEKLHAADELDTLQGAHLRYYAEFMREHATDIKGRRQVEGLNEIEADFENVRTAWQYAIAQSDYSALDVMMEGLVLFCDMRARYQDGEDLLHQAVAALAPQSGEASHPVWNRLRISWLQIWAVSERFPIPDSIQQQLADIQSLAHEQDDDEVVALCLWTHGELKRVGHTKSHRLEALQFYDSVLPHFESRSAVYYVGRVLRGVSMCYLFLQMADSQYQEGLIQTQERHLAICRQTTDLCGLAHAILYQAVSSESFAEMERACQEAIAIWRKTGDVKSVGVAMFWLGSAYLFNGQFDQAQATAYEAQQIENNVNYHNHSSLLFGFLANLETQYDQGQAWLAEPITAPAEYMLFLQVVGQTQASYGLGNYAAARRYLRRSFDFQNYVPNVWMALIWSSAVLLLAGDNQQVLAVEMLGLAYSNTSDLTRWLDKWPLFIQVQQDLHAELGEQAYQLAWQRGAQRASEAAIAKLLVYLGGDQVVPGVDPASQPLIEPLTERERDVLALLAEGLSNREIANELTVTVGTAKTHVHNISQKLGASNRTQAVAHARSLGLI